PGNRGWLAYGLVISRPRRPLVNVAWTPPWRRGGRGQHRMGRLDGKGALISGTARGMGGGAGAGVAAPGAGGVGGGPARRASGGGGRMAALAPVDLAGAAGARAWVEAAVAGFGGVDILYNNASALRNGALMDLSDDDWHFTVRNELDIVWFSVRAAWPELV